MQKYEAWSVIGAFLLGAFLVSLFALRNVVEHEYAIGDPKHTERMIDGILDKCVSNEWTDGTKSEMCSPKNPNDPNIKSKIRYSK